MRISSRDYIEGDYEKHIRTLTKENMEKLFVDNFGGWSDSVSEKKFFDVLKNGIVKLFFIGDVFVGYVSFMSEKDFDRSFMINDIHVVRKFQGKGYGTLMLDYVVSKAVESGIIQLRVFVFEKNPSIGFYRKQGFEEVEFLSKSNTYVMRRKISNNKIIKQ